NDRPEDQSYRARYGGNILDPTTISPDVKIKIQLTNDATIKQIEYAGLKDTHAIRVWPGKNESGIRDDPFIFPRFFKKNVVAMVFNIPLSCFDEIPEQWIAWSTTAKNGKQIDHAGRSLRTQQPRFNFLNTIPPKSQAAAV